MKKLFVVSFVLTFCMSFMQLSAQRKALLEVATGSWCGPCATLNGTMNGWIENNLDKCVVVKYQTSPDPYATSDGNIRCNYYGVQYVPTSVVNGVNSYIGGSDASSIQNKILSEASIPAEANITGTFKIIGTNIHVEAEVTPLISGSGYKIHVAVNEKTTFGNKGSNGEKEFHHVLMKMLSGALGLPASLDLEAGTSITLSASCDMAATHVEEMSDLEVAVFVQHIDDKTVLNAAYLEDISTPAPNNVVATNEEGTLNINVSWEAPTGVTPTGYNIYKDGVKLNDSPLSATTFSYSDVVSEYGVTYKYGVAAIVDGFEGYYGYDEAMAIVDVPAPIHVKATQVQAGEKLIKITWEIPNVDFSISGYNIYRNNIKINSALVTDLFFESTGLSFREYCFEIEAIVNELISDKSEKGCVTLKEDGIAAPTNLTAVIAVVGERKIDLAWDAVTGVTIDGYNIYRDESKINVDPITATTYQDEAPGGGEYCYTVAAVFEETAGFRSEEACVLIPESISSANLETAVNIYPNPVTDKLHLDTELNVTEYQIFDLQGRLIYSSKANAKEVSTSEWAAGVYIIKVTTDKGVVNKRFVKQ